MEDRLRDTLGDGLYKEYLAHRQHLDTRMDEASAFVLNTDLVLDKTSFHRSTGGIPKYTLNLPGTMPTYLASLSCKLPSSKLIIQILD